MGHYFTYSNSRYGDDEVDHFSVVGICDGEVHNSIEIFYYASMVYQSFL
jgi:hypothetical protein